MRHAGFENLKTQSFTSCGTLSVGSQVTEYITLREGVPGGLSSVRIQPSVLTTSAGPVTSLLLLPGGGF